MQRKAFGIFCRHVFTCIWQSALVEFVLNVLFFFLSNHHMFQLLICWESGSRFPLCGSPPPPLPQSPRAVPGRCPANAGCGQKLPAWASSLISSLRKYNWSREDAIGSIHRIWGKLILNIALGVITPNNVLEDKTQGFKWHLKAESVCLCNSIILAVFSVLRGSNNISSSIPSH